MGVGCCFCWLGWWGGVWIGSRRRGLFVRSCWWIWICFCIFRSLILVFMLWLSRVRCCLLWRSYWGGLFRVWCKGVGRGCWCWRRLRVGCLCRGIGLGWKGWLLVLIVVVIFWGNFGGGFLKIKDRLEGMGVYCWIFMCVWIRCIYMYMCMSMYRRFGWRVFLDIKLG